MRCDEFEQRLNSLLDDRRAPELDAELVDHADCCAPCDELLRGQQYLLEGLQLAGLPEPPPNFADLVFDQPTLRRRRHAWIAPVAGIAVAASLLAMAFLPDAESPSGPSVSPVPSPVVSVAPAAPGLAISTDAAAAFDKLDASTKEDLRFIVRGMSGDFAVPAEPLEGVDELAGGLRPVGSTLGGALNAIVQTMPGQKPSKSRAD